MLREAAGDRFHDIELNLLIAVVDKSAEKVNLAINRQATGLGDAQLTRLPGVLIDSPRAITDRLLRSREEFDTGHISVLEPHVAAFAEVIRHLR